MDSNSQESRKNALERELNELLEAKHMIEGEIFQKYFATPLYKEKKELKDAYECDSLKELWQIKGKKWGVDRFYRCVAEIDTRTKFVRSDLEKL